MWCEFLRGGCRLGCLFSLRCGNFGLVGCEITWKAGRGRCSVRRAFLLSRFGILSFVSACGTCSGLR